MGAARRSRVKVGETHATSGQLVEDGRLHRTAVAADVAVTQIVSQKKDDVRTGGGAQGGGREEDKR
jgi:hypothetical protein|tara:strand:- start:294 stop:491 length:198 start_codon:yes stop_codon:yes gene_type:complete